MLLSTNMVTRRVGNNDMILIDIHQILKTGPFIHLADSLLNCQLETKLYVSVFDMRNKRHATAADNNNTDDILIMSQHKNNKSCIVSCGGLEHGDAYPH